MIRPLLTPRRVTGNANTRLISAARNGLRNIQRSTNLISSAPNVTKEQNFGINYVDFFGSKKVGKDLRKSMETIRDSVGTTFDIAKSLKESVTRGAGVFGFVGKLIGGAAAALPIFTLLGLPVLKSVLGLLAVGGLGTLLFTFKDQILNFLQSSSGKVFDIIKSKSTGFRDFVRDSVKEFFIDANKSGLFTTVRDRSVDRLEESLSEVKSLQDIEKANQNEIKLLKAERDAYKKQNPDKTNTEEYRQQVKAYDDRITEIKTGKIPVDLNRAQRFIKNKFKIGPVLGVGQKAFQRFTTETGAYPENYSTLNESQKENAMLRTLGSVSPTFNDEGNLNENITKLSQTYMRDLERGNLLESQKEFANDVLEYLKEITNSQTVNSGQPSSTAQSTEQSFSNLFAKRKNKGALPKSLLDAYPNLDPTKARDYMKLKRLMRETDLAHAGNNLSVLPMGNSSPQPDLVKNDTGGLSSGPSMRLYSNVDHDNYVALINKSSLNVV